MADRPPKSRSGPTQPERERKRGQVLLRLSDGARARLEAIAERAGMSRSAIVEALILSAR